MTFDEFEAILINHRISYTREEHVFEVFEGHTLRDLTILPEGVELSTFKPPSR